MQQAMYARNYRSQFRHHRQSAIAPKATLAPGDQYGMGGRSMGPPLSFPPQPVEIEPGSYPRTPGSYVSWETSAYPTSFIAVSDPSVTSNAGTQRIGPIVLDLGLRNPSPDSLSTWWSSNDSPWFARGAVPDATVEERFQARYNLSHRGAQYGSPLGVPNRLLNLSDTGSVQFRVPPSDSGYGTIFGPESASVRGTDVHEHSPDNQSITGRIHETRPYHEDANSHEGGPWPVVQQNASPFRCGICQKPAKNRSELKKHNLRHTRPFHCTNEGCTRADGFSTSNDLDRHIKCKHPNDLPEGYGSKTYHCLVVACKSRSKTWPRLDNFKSHLKRVHRLQDENDLEYYVHKALVNPPVSKGQISHRNSVQGMKELDQEDPIIEEPEDFSSLPWEDDPEWTQGTLAVGRQEILDPLMEISSPKNPSTASGECLVEMEGAHEQADCLPNRTAEPHGCLEKETTLPSTDVICNSTGSGDKTGQGSPEGSLPANEPVEGGKIAKEPAAIQIDPYLHNAIIAALFGTATTNDTGANPGSKSLLENGEQPAARAAAVESCMAAGDLPLPSPASLAGTPAGNPEDLKLGSDISNPECDKSNLMNQNLSLILNAIKNAGYVLKKDNESQAGLSSTADHSKSGAPKKRDRVSCSQCTKFSGRPSDLKKHMKRHSKPYGCTYPECSKIFGSKNDWRRHENSQHYQHEFWQCDEKSEDGAPCRKLFYTADNARAHFTKIHKVNEIEAGRKLDQRRCSPNHQSWFWCGFCERKITLTEKGLEAWNQRFNHIDDHFMGRNGRVQQSIAEWKHNADGIHILPKSSSFTDEEGSGESSTESSPSSPTHSSRSRDPSPQRPGVEKRKLDGSDEQEQPERPAKHAKHGKHEWRVFCCDCHLDYNPKTDAACPFDGHVLCEGCERKQVPVHGDERGGSR